MLRLRWWDCLEGLSRSLRAHLPSSEAVGSSSKHQPMAPSRGIIAGACTLPTLRILKPCVMPRRLKSRPFHGAFVPSALRNSWSSSFARSPSAGGRSELMVVTARPGSTCWTDGGGSASLLVARPERTINGRLCAVKSDGYASIITPCPSRVVSSLYLTSVVSTWCCFSELWRAEVLRSEICSSHENRKARRALPRCCIELAISSVFVAAWR